ncbi:MAG: oligogalacturonate lyase [Armatimonadaceae bacterium]
MSKIRFNDEQTGREVWRMTHDESVSFAPYMYRRAFSQDERYLVYSSDATGKREVWRVALEDGDAQPLTDADDYSSMSMILTVDSAGHEAWFIDGTTIAAVEIETGRNRSVVDLGTLTGGKPTISMMLSPDAEQVLVSFVRKEDGRQAVALAPTHGLASAEEVYAWDPEVSAITHLLFSPTEPGTITYNRHPDRQNDFTCTESERARCWKLNLETGSDVPFLTVPTGYRATHEYWAADGSRLYFHQKTQPGWIPAMICSIPRDGGPITEHYRNDTVKLGHSSVSTDQAWMVSDSQEPGQNPLLLINPSDGTAETLCWPNASGAPHPNHVHPSFSPSGRYIVYTSDVTGTAQVYVVPLMA